MTYLEEGVQQLRLALVHALLHNRRHAAERGILHTLVVVQYMLQ